MTWVLIQLRFLMLGRVWRAPFQDRSSWTVCPSDWKWTRSAQQSSLAHFPSLLGTKSAISTGLWTSASFLAEASVGSPRKLFTLLTKNKKCLDQSIQNVFYSVLKTEALVWTATMIVYESNPLLHTSTLQMLCGTQKVRSFWGDLTGVLA